MTGFNVKLTLLSNGRTWQAEIFDPSDGYVLEVYWSENRDRLLRKCKKFAAKASIRVSRAPEIIAP